MDSAVKPPGRESLHAGDLLIDIDRQRVTRAGVELALPRLSFELLVALADAYPRMLSIEELMDGVWAPAVVSPETVSHRVKLLRQALGDDPARPRYVVGVRGRGYRMEAPVTRASAAPAPAPPAAASPAAPIVAPARRGLLVPVAIALVTLVALAVALAWLTRRGAEPVAATAAPAEKSVAVLPFVDLSEQKDQGYFADGMAEEIIGLLARTSDLKVAARTSSFYYKDRNAPIGEIARTLGVAHVLEGSVRKSGDKLRVSVQLIRASDGFHVWSATYDRPLDDVFRMQDEIAGRVAATLEATLLNARSPHASPTTNREAYALYLQALSLYYRATPDANDRASAYLRQALALDARFAGAWALLAETRTDAFFQYSRAPLAAARRDAFDAATRALGLDPGLAEAHLALANVLWTLDWDTAAAEREIQQALKLDPGNALARRAHASLLEMRARFDEAEVAARAALALDPVNARSYVVLGEIQWFAGRTDDAKASLRKAIEINPDGAYQHVELAVIMMMSGDAKGGLAELERDSSRSEIEIVRPSLLFALGRREEGRRALAHAERAYADVGAHEIAMCYALNHESARALDWLERAYRNHESILLWLRVDPPFRELWPDPRFKALLARLRLGD